MALDKIITRLQPANDNTLYDIGVFADKVFLGNDLDESNTLASMLNRYITPDSNGNICIDGYGESKGSIISKANVNTASGGALQSILFTDKIANTTSAQGILGLKKSLIFGEGFTNKRVEGLTNSFIFGVNNAVKLTLSSAVGDLLYSNPLLENCGIIGEDNSIIYDNNAQNYTTMAKNSLIVGKNNYLANEDNNDNVTLENSLIVGNNNQIWNNGSSVNTMCFGNNNNITNSGIILGNNLKQHGENSVTVGAFNNEDDNNGLVFEVGIGTGEQNRKTGFGVGMDNDIYIYGPSGYFVLKATNNNSLQLIAYDRDGQQKASTTLIQW